MPPPVGRDAPYLPGLDGIRALAVLAVVAFHLGVPHLDGGLLGVSMFFTLSGCLITGLLLSAWDRTGRFDLRTFWIRRARRLLPALVLVVVAVLLATLLVDRGDLAARWHEAVASALYVSNWTAIADGSAYADVFAGPQPLDHLWSLAIEEQFYLVWPLLLAGLLYVANGDRVVVGRVTVLLALASFLLLAVLTQPGIDHTRSYVGTDTRAGELLVGAALALYIWPGDSRPGIPAPRSSDVTLAGCGSLVVLTALVVNTDYHGLFLYQGGLLLTALATAALIVAAAQSRGPVGRVLGVAPLRWIGARSYGIYLWHMPVIAFAPPDPVGPFSLWHAVLCTAVTLVLAELSWRFVEDPIRRHGLRGAIRLHRQDAPGQVHTPAPWATVQTRQATPTMAFGVGTLAVALVATVSLVVAGAITPDREPDPALLASLTADTGRAATASASPTAGAGKRNGASAPAPVPADPRRRVTTSCDEVVHVGDSTSVGLVAPTVLRRRDRIDRQFEKVGVSTPHTDIRGARSIVETYKGQPNAAEATGKRMAEGYDGCWVFAMGTNDTANQSVGGSVPLADRIDRLMDKVGDAPTMWVTVRSQLSRGPWSEANMRVWNDALVAACERHPSMRVYDWAAEARDTWFLSDGIHFTTQGYRQQARRIAEALGVAFPSGGSAAESCVVGSGSS